jgi:hypothetical protein
MQAAIRKRPNGSIALKLDANAARAVFASVVFAARFHDGFAPLIQIAKEGLKRDSQEPARRGEPCR